MLTLIKGDSIIIPVEIESEDGTIINLTGKTVFFTIKRKSDRLEDDSAAILTKDVTVHTNPTNGSTSITIDAEDWEGIPYGEFVWDLQIEGSDQKPVSTVPDIVCIVNDVTKRRWTL